jgi:hypothetical protein
VATYLKSLKLRNRAQTQSQNRFLYLTLMLLHIAKVFTVGHRNIVPSIRNLKTCFSVSCRTQKGFLQQFKAAPYRKSLSGSLPRYRYQIWKLTQTLWHTWQTLSVTGST